METKTAGQIDIVKMGNPEPTRGGILFKRSNSLLLLEPYFRAGLLRIWTFDLLNRKWEELTHERDENRDASYIESVFMPVALMNDDKIFIFGGKTNSNIMLDDFFVYDLVERKYTKDRLSDPDMKPSGRYACAQAVKGSKAYFFGGIGNDGLKNDVWAFDSGEMRFLKIFTGNESDGGRGEKQNIDQSIYCPSRRYGAAMVLKNDRLIIFGGYTSRSDLNTVRRMFNDIWEFNLATSAWKLISEDFDCNYLEQKRDKNIPLGRYCNIIALHNDELIVAFGATGGSEGFGWHFLEDMYRVDLSSSSISWKKTVPDIEVLYGEYKPGEGIKAPAFVQSGNEIFCYGGQLSGGHSNSLIRLKL